MPRFLHQISYTPEAIAQLIAHPQDRFEAVRAPIEKLGGRIEHGYFAFGEHGRCAHHRNAGQRVRCTIALAFGRWRHGKELRYHRLLTAAEAQDRNA